MKNETLSLIPRLKEMVDHSDRVVFFGGAGVSTESGIPDFRGSKGIYTVSRQESPEYLLSHTCLVREREKFFDFYRNGMLYPSARPNAAHLALARGEANGKIKAVVTQNIDGLHQEAGSKSVFELHGSVKRNFCESCGKVYDDSFILSGKGVPRCPSCGGLIRPDVVLYEEGLDMTVLNSAVDAVLSADMLIVGGSSLLVQPAASLVGMYRGKKLVIINYGHTPYDDSADVRIYDSVGEVLDAIF